SVLEEPTYTEGTGDRSTVKRVLLTSGKLYYELAARKNKEQRDDVAIVRIEQLAPLPRRRLAETLDQYPNAQEYFWVQEEPANQGAWPTMGLTLPEVLPEKLTGIKRISRRAMSAPSSGSSKVHAVEQQEIIDEAFG
ncbi:MAG: multifunctional oxoglutarate decarboxylase/oxoglutarate dehydrogenase thiamine pyrophosphate-binding subunit/dihydrolipoyllysine-residue succinyltransferase subunit, partial [Dietzia sp.]|nr:multifunctional oxoglutarate decarboxylase/oxoglutarate dehydrogenase thiamine pyrophosphate-binding subunit/dihydrolipoyllysine-residue succinyltransferase subunit [Dietzia sp.]